MRHNQQIYKQPISVLVIIHDEQYRILLLERADKPDFWQSVTGSRENCDQSLLETAIREVHEETGIVANLNQLKDWQYCSQYEIFPHWRYRYAPDVTHNTEHVFSLCIPADSQIMLAPSEHLNYGWYEMAVAADKVFSPSNRSAILNLPQYLSLSTLFIE